MSATQPVFPMIYALVIIDEAGNLIYHWKHKDAPKEAIKKFVPELISGFISAIVSFGSEIFDAPRYIDMGFAGASIVKLNVKSRSLLVFVLADRDDDPSAITRFVSDFRKRVEDVLDSIISRSDIGLVITKEEDIAAIDRVMHETIQKHLRWLPSIRSSDKKSFVFTYIVSIPLIMVLASIFYFVYLLMFPSNTSIESAAYFLVFWWIPTIIMGIIVGYIACRAVAGFFAGLLSYLTYWLFLAIINEIMLIALLGGSMYGIIVAIFGYVSGKYFDSIMLTMKHISKK